MSLLSTHTPSDLTPASPPGRLTALRRATRIVGWTGITLALAGALWLSAGYIAFRDRIAPVEPRHVAAADAIVVLTGGPQRLTEALTLLAERKGRKLLISGVNERTARDEITRLVADRRALMDCCVDLGRSARNTIGNAIEARRWARANGFRSLIVVTANYHLPRTLEEFGHVLGDVRLIGYPVVADGPEPAAPSHRMAFAEYAKYEVSRLRRLIEQDPERSRLPALVGRQKPVGPLPIETASPGSS
jgi:uncharacterized SAM-binding protein YcdF (DUF218 family)